MTTAGKPPRRSSGLTVRGDVAVVSASGGSAIKLGLGLPHAGPLATRENILQAALGAEAIGLDSVWVLDRVLRPLSPKWGERPPPFYSTVFDPIDTLAFVAARTERVALGTSVIQALLHSPVMLARRLATLDVLSGGRIVAGLGQGWMPEEFATAAVPLDRRGRGMVEWIAAVRAVWGPDPVEFHGEFYRIPQSDIGPKPTRPIPILLGYHSEQGIRLAAHHADGILPNRRDLAALQTDLNLFRIAASEAKRDATSMHVVYRGAARLETSSTERLLFVGSLDAWADDVVRLATLGVQHVHLQMQAPIALQLETMAELHARTRGCPVMPLK